MEIRENADVAVLGAGPAGVAAAIAAARHGCSTVLIEQSGCSGGMAAQALVGPFMTCYDASGTRQIIRGLFEEFVQRMAARGGALDPAQIRAGTCYTSWIVAGHDHVTPFDPECLKRVLDEMLLEAGVRVYYHTSVLEPVMTGNRIRAVRVSSKSGLEEIGAKVFIDCTGDADVAWRCGVPCALGDSESGRIQPATMFFRIGNVDDAKVEAEIAAHRDQFYRKDGVNYRSFHWLVTQAREHGDWPLQRTSIGLFHGVRPGEWSVNTSRLMGVDATDNRSLTQGEIEGRAQVETIFAFLKKYVPGCEDARLLCTGATLGIRESRHIRGRKTMQLADIEQGRVPEDTILLAANSVDIHGRFGPLSNEYITVQNGDWYGIPYGCLLPEGVENLLVAGRCVSATSEAAGAIRVMPPCTGMGQAAGTAAALACAEQVLVRDVDVARLQQALRSDGAYLPPEAVGGKASGQTAAAVGILQKTEEMT